jgi:hypothetical protein
MIQVVSTESSMPGCWLGKRRFSADGSTAYASESRWWAPTEEALKKPEVLRTDQALKKKE